MKQYVVMCLVCAVTAVGEEVRSRWWGLGEALFRCRLGVSRWRSARSVANEVYDLNITCEGGEVELGVDGYNGGMGSRVVVWLVVTARRCCLPRPRGMMNRTGSQLLKLLGRLARQARDIAVAGGEHTIINT